LIVLATVNQLILYYYVAHSDFVQIKDAKKRQTLSKDSFSPVLAEQN
jgi:hypothetical protein